MLANLRETVIFRVSYSSSYESIFGRVAEERRNVGWKKRTWTKERNKDGLVDSREKLISGRASGI